MTDPFVPAIAIGVVALGFFRRFRTIFNPPTLHAFGFAAQLFLYAMMSMFIAGQGLHFELTNDIGRVATAYLVASVSFAVPWLAMPASDGFLRIDSSAPAVRDLRSLQLFLLCEAFALAAVVAVAISLMGFPLGQMLSGRLDVQQMQENAKTLPAGLLAMNLWLGILLSLHLAASIVYRRHYQLNTKRIVGIASVIVFSSVWQAKRQVLLIMLLFVALFLVADRARHRSRGRIILGLIIAFGIFAAAYVGVQLVRVGDTGSGGVFYSEGILSAIWPLLNLDGVMASTHGIGQLHSLLSQLIPNRWYGHGYEGFLSVLFEPTASISYVLYAYYDFGLPGIAGAAFVFGVVTVAASSMFTASVTGVQIRALILWICLSSPVYPHAFSLNFFLMPVALLFFIRASFGSRLYRKSADSACPRLSEGVTSIADASASGDAMPT